MCVETLRDLLLGDETGVPAMAFRPCCYRKLCVRWGAPHAEQHVSRHGSSTAHRSGLSPADRDLRRLPFPSPSLSLGYKLSVSFSSGSGQEEATGWPPPLLIHERPGGLPRQALEPRIVPAILRPPPAARLRQR